MDTGVIIAIIAAAAALGGGFFSYRAAAGANRLTAQANRMTGQKIDSEAFDRTQHIYQSAIAEADRTMERLRGQVDRLNENVDRVTVLLAGERDASVALRSHVFTLERQVAVLCGTIDQLRSQLAAVPHSPNVIPPPTITP